MINLDNRNTYANLPTPIQKIDYLTNKLDGTNFYLKRDDFTGSEYLGNKVRKLEFSLFEAKKQNCDYVITCGATQSNHCRATASVCAKEGIKCVLVLRGTPDSEIDGNYFLDKLFGAEIKFITPEEYSESRMEIMQKIKDDLAKDGHVAYIIPEGASNGIGNFGYVKCIEEIMQYEKENNISFDYVCCATGSGGTFSGLVLGNKIFNRKGKVVSVNVCDTKDYFKKKVLSILEESNTYLTEKLNFTLDDIDIYDGYVGEGYGIPSLEDIQLIKEIGKNTGIIIDPVYNVKGLRGFLTELQKGTFKDAKNVLFINTGGAFGIFAAKDKFNF